ncbi:serine arginine-rich splicing factor [Mortierella sp. AD010]|nr:serine arginine-rich splicing factor [Mortierella sp. AD010]
MGTRVYLGRLSRDASDRDVENLFKNYGRLREVTLKNGFGFVEFSDPRDAKDAVYDIHGKDFMGERLVVELARGDRRDRREERDDRRYTIAPNKPMLFMRLSNDFMENYLIQFLTYRFRPPERTEYRLIIENLTHGVSWQDIKDFMRKAGEVTFADINKDDDSQGVVEFSSADDVQSALKTLNGEELRGSPVTLREVLGCTQFDPSRDTAPRDMGRGGGRDRDRGRDYGRDRDRRRSRSRSRDRHDRYRRQSRSRSRDRRDRDRRRSRSRSPRRRDGSRDRRSGRGSRRSRSPVRERTPVRERSPSRERSGSPAAPRDRSRSASRD